MKIRLFVVVFVLVLPSLAHAQLNAPVHAEITPSVVDATHPAPTSYELTLDTQPVIVVPPTLDAGCACVRYPAQGAAPWTVDLSQPHNFKVVAVFNGGIVTTRSAAATVATAPVQVPNIPGFVIRPGQ